MSEPTTPSTPTPKTGPGAASIVARSIYRELRATGFAERDVMELASELLALVTADMRARGPAAPR
ncbi:MAG: hypothetical protein IT376_06325 [Polyangiaceae bacterium]|nr:hypothetical protein [Polyangiaceae bacterium]